MVEGRAKSGRRDVLLDKLGGPPGSYVVACVVLTVVWFPFRLLLDKGDPMARIVAASGLHGAMWALMPLAGEWVSRVRRKTVGYAAVPSATSAEQRAWARRGAIVGLGAGVPFFGAFIALCLITGRSWVYTTSFTVLLLVVVAVAIRSLRRGSEDSTG